MTKRGRWAQHPELLHERSRNGVVRASELESLEMSSRTIYRTEQLLHSYLPDSPKTTPVAIRRWEQEAWIEESGDTWVRRKVTMAESADLHLRYLTSTSVCYGTTKLCPRHRGEAGIRSTRPTTSRWSETEREESMLTVFVHLGRTVEEGDVVIPEWHWPKYSADLMKGIRPEPFDTLFTTTVAESDLKVTSEKSETTRR
ncbi:MAG TPA: hypothetical protein VFG15_24160 [Amycolatopsis sp.]|nr:hypothetical protein [Amycolatopsis sp.]